MGNPVARVDDQTPGYGQEEARASLALLPGLYNPLQHLVAAAELLDRQRLTPEARACARAILQSGRMVLTVMEDLRHLGAVGDRPSTPTVTPLSDLLDEVEALWRLQTAPSAGRLLLSCAAPPGLAVTIDATAVKQAMNTLIGRALAAGEAGVVEAVLRFDPSAGQGRLSFTVGQNLPAAGPDPQDAALALAGAIAHRLGGEIERRPNPGQGERTAIHLPAPLAEAPVEADEDEAPVLGRHTHALIVDDNATNRMVAAAICEMFGCTTETAEDGVEAVEAARASRFDLILMDIKMPRMDGIEATRAIRRLPGALGRTPIVALTANGDAEAAKVYLANGMDAVVEKPIKPDRLLATLQAVLEQTDSEPLAERSSSAA